MRRQTRRIFRKYRFAEMPPEDAERRLKEENPFYRAFRALGHIKLTPEDSRGVFVRAPDSDAVYHISAFHWTPIKAGEESMLIDATNEKGVPYKPVLNASFATQSEAYPGVNDLAIRKIPKEYHDEIPEILTLARGVPEGETGWLIGNDVRHLPEDIQSVEDYMNRILPQADQLISGLAPSRLWLPAGWRTDLWNYSMPVEVEMGGINIKDPETKVQFYAKREQSKLKGNFPGVLPGHSGSPVVNREGKLMTIVGGGSNISRRSWGSVAPRDLGKLLKSLSKVNIDDKKIRKYAKNLKDLKDLTYPEIRNKIEESEGAPPITLEGEKVVLEKLISTEKLVDYVRETELRRMLSRYRGYREEMKSLQSEIQYLDSAKEILRERLEEPTEESVLLSEGPATIKDFITIFKGGEEKVPPAQKKFNLQSRSIVIEEK